MKATAKEIEALVPVGFWGRVRRAFGIFTEDEKEVLRYARKVHGLAVRIAKGKTALATRPEWLRQEDYRSLRNLQKKVDGRRAR